MEKRQYISILHTKKIHNLNPLCITHGQNWMSLTGRYNLEIVYKNLVDHLIFIPSRKILKNIAKKSVYQIGDACWHCHVEIGSRFLYKHL